MTSPVKEMIFITTELCNEVIPANAISPSISKSGANAKRINARPNTCFNNLVVLCVHRDDDEHDSPGGF